MKSSHPRSTTARQKILHVTEMAGEHHTVIPLHKSAEHRDHEHSTGTRNKDPGLGRRCYKKCAGYLGLWGWGDVQTQKQQKEEGFVIRTNTLSRQLALSKPRGWDDAQSAKIKHKNLQTPFTLGDAALRSSQAHVPDEQTTPRMICIETHLQSSEKKHKLWKVVKR